MKEAGLAILVVCALLLAFHAESTRAAASTVPKHARYGYKAGDFVFANEAYWSNVVSNESIGFPEIAGVKRQASVIAFWGAHTNPEVPLWTPAPGNYRAVCRWKFDANSIFPPAFKFIVSENRGPGFNDMFNPRPYYGLPWFNTVHSRVIRATGNTTVLVMFEETDTSTQKRGIWLDACFLEACSDANCTMVNECNTYRTPCNDTEVCTDLPSGYRCAAPCGNGVVDAGEQCDGGPCCRSDCTFASPATVCRNASSACDITETCTGNSATCPVDNYQKGAFALDGQCYPCFTGTYNEVLGPCKACPSGTFANMTGQPLCDICPAGTFSIVSKTNCTKCPAGSYSWPGSDKCLPCPPGSSTRGVAGATTCTRCLAGTYSKGGAPACTPCPVGYYNNLLTSPDLTTCTPCPANTMAAKTGSTSCTACPAGRYSFGGSSCLACPVPPTNTKAGSLCVR